MDNIDMSEIFVYEVSLPDGVHEAVTPCLNGYTVYINSRLSYEQRKKAFIHALLHIKNSDFEKDDVQTIEAEAHTT